MEKQTKISYSLFGLVIISIVLHNILSVSLAIEEPIFFILTFIFALGFAISVIYNIITYTKKCKPKDLWKLGFIGLFGLIGLWPKFGFGFYGFFGFFGFFGLKRK